MREKLRLDPDHRNSLQPQFITNGTYLFVENIADRRWDDHNQTGPVAAPGILDRLAQFSLSAANDVLLLQVGGQHIVKRLVPPPGRVTVVESTAPGAVDDRKHILHLSHCAHTTRNLSINTKCVQQTRRIHCGHQIFKKGLSHAHFSSLPRKAK